MLFFFLSEKSESFPGATLNATSIEPNPPTTVPLPTLSMLTRQTGDSKLPQAIVKPQILTHIIEGFVIQEGAEPFPVRGLRAWGRLDKGCSPFLFALPW